jgi:CheY-like chemotaxis protein
VAARAATAGAAAAVHGRVLVAEDNEVNRLVITAMLERRGIAPAVAGDGREALAMLAAGDYDLALVDCQMPELDGYETTAAIRAGEAPGGRRLPIVAMTANAMRGDRERCLAAGMDDYLAKPLRADELDGVLQRWLRVQDASDALVDAARVRAFRDDYPEIAGRLVDLFTEGTPPVLAELRAAVAEDDFERVRRCAHKLKGSCQNIGATSMATLCGTLEEDAHAGTLAQLDAAFAPTEHAIRALLAPGA